MLKQPNLHRYKVIISYDGTSYSGWQLQPNGITIQGLLEEALLKIVKKQVRVIGAGRTDAGVHALAQVAHFDLEECLDPIRLPWMLNGILPHAIRIRACSHVPETFHAQRSAQGKEYHYHVWQERIIDPFVQLYRHYFPKQLSLELVKAAAQHFVGTHDFASFANLGSSAKTTIRTITRLELIEQEGGFRLEFEGNGFLYKMVRNITGVLLEIGSGKREINQLTELFAQKERQASGAAATAKGLFLVKVNYQTTDGEQIPFLPSPKA